MTTADEARSGTETTGAVPSRQHFAGFESLRALAATMVVVHHAAFVAGARRAGALATPAAVMDGGVAVFFVLSGFLIYRPFVTALLEDRPAQSTLAFWWRRVLRIVPAYWLVLTFFWSIGNFHLGHDWWRYYFFLQPFSRFTAIGGIVQAWSLSTEISFYVLVPGWALATRWVLRRVEPAARARGALACCGVLWVMGPLSRAMVDRWAPGRRGLAFQWLPANLDLFAAGMALAVVSVAAGRSPVLRTRLDRVATTAWPWWTAAAGIFGWYAYRVGGVDLSVGYSGWFWQRRQLTFGLFTMVLLVPAVFGDQTVGQIRRIWSWRPLVWVGTVSYGLYLWHLDWIERAVTAPPDAQGTVGWHGWRSTPFGDTNFWYLLTVGLGLGLVSAAVSWYLLEQPLQRLKGLVGSSGDRRALGAPEGPG